MNDDFQFLKSDHIQLCQYTAAEIEAVGEQNKMSGKHFIICENILMKTFSIGYHVVV